MKQIGTLSNARSSKLLAFRVKMTRNRQALAPCSNRKKSMDITYENKMNVRRESTSVAELVTSVLTYTDYYVNGEVGTAREIADNTAKMLGRLIDQLAHAGIIDEDDLNEIVQHYTIGRITKC